MDIFARILNFTLMIAIPIILGVYLANRFKADWRLFGIGMLTFIVSQVFHLPFNRWVLSPMLANLGLNNLKETLPLIAFALLMGLSAGLFEEITRYLAFRFWIKEARSWKEALMFGAGHGGFEAIILGVLAMIAFIQIISLRGTDISTLVSPDKVALARSQITSYWAAPWYAALLGAVERIFAIAFHLSAAVLLLQSFRKHNILWLGAAIGWHTLFDAIAVFSSQRFSIYTTEAIIAVCGLISIGIIFSLRDPKSDQNIQSKEPLNLFQIESPGINRKPSPESIEDSRYDG